MTVPNHISNQLRKARRAQCEGHYALAVTLTCGALESMLCRRESSIIRLLLRTCPWPSGSTRLLHTETGARIELCQQVYAESESRRHLDYADKLLSALPARTFVETLSMLLHRLAGQCVVSPMALSRRRWLLHCLHRLRAPLLSHLLPAAAHREALASGLGALLHEPHAAVLRILSQHEFYFHYNYAKRIEHRPEAVAKGLRRAFLWPEQDVYSALVHRCPGSRVLVTIHMGDFVGAFRCIADEVTTGRTVMSLRRERHDAVPHVLNPGLRVQVLRHGVDAPAIAVAGLRTDCQSVGLLFDLCEDFGATTEVLFFGHKAQLVKGPALLAIAGRTPIIPFVTWECEGVDRIEMEDMIDTHPLPGESLAMAVNRVTQKLALLAEKWIRRAPEQWQYLPSLLGYFSAAAACAGSTRQ